MFARIERKISFEVHLYQQIYNIYKKIICNIEGNDLCYLFCSDMLKLGSSVSWQEAMEKITGQRMMSADALLEYFRPLTEWLKKQNEGVQIGWDDSCPGNELKRSVDIVESWLVEYNEVAQQKLYLLNEVEWGYATNITDENSKKVVSKMNQTKPKLFSIT